MGDLKHLEYNKGNSAWLFAALTKYCCLFLALEDGATAGFQWNADLVGQGGMAALSEKPVSTIGQISGRPNL